MLGELQPGRALVTSRDKPEGQLRLDLSELEQQSQATTLFDDYDLDAVYCVAGMTYVDGCESKPELAWRINARGPGIMAAYAKSRRLPFVYFSTEYVFDGLKENPGPYVETARTGPLNVCGKTKLEGEQRVLAAHPEALVIGRTARYALPNAPERSCEASLLHGGKHLRCCARLASRIANLWQT